LTGERKRREDDDKLDDHSTRFSIHHVSSIIRGRSWRRSQRTYLNTPDI
jgi:hypothetical protein